MENKMEKCYIPCLSVRASNTLDSADLFRESEIETRKAVRKGLENGSIAKICGCGKGTLSELRAWLESPCSEPIDLRCLGCKYWCSSESAKDGMGVCRARAPTAILYGVYRTLTGDVNASANEAWWPQTGMNDWCGEFKDK